MTLSGQHFFRPIWATKNKNVNKKTPLRINESGSPSSLPLAHLKETLPGVRTRRGRDLVHLSMKCYLSWVISLPCIGPTANTQSLGFRFSEISGLMFTLPFSRWGETHTKTNSDATWDICWIYSLQTTARWLTEVRELFIQVGRENPLGQSSERILCSFLKRGILPKKTTRPQCSLCTKRAFVLGMLAPSSFSQKQATEPKLLFSGWFVDVRKGGQQMPHINFMASLHHQ